MCAKCTAICAACGLEFITRPGRPAKFCSEPCRLPSLQSRILDRVQTEGDCLVWTGWRDADGYGRLWASDDHYARLHRTVLEWKIGRLLEEGECALHHCDNPPCVKPAHLFVGTVADNNSDKMSKLRYVKGNDHPRSKLTPEAVVEIFTSKEPARVMAQRFSVSLALIHHVRSGRNWKHLTDPLRA